MNFFKLLSYSTALSLLMAGIVRFLVKWIDNKRFSVASFLWLTALVAMAVVVYLAGLKWSPR